MRFALLTWTVIVTAGWAIPLEQAEEVAAAAIVAGDQWEIPSARLVAMAWRESRYQNILGDGGAACGVLQLHPRWTPGYTCDDHFDILTTFLVGAQAYHRWRRVKGERVAAGHFNSGRELTTRGRAYQRGVDLDERRFNRYMGDPATLAGRAAAAGFR